MSTQRTSGRVAGLGKHGDSETDTDWRKGKGCVQEVSQWQVRARAKEGSSVPEGAPKEQKRRLQMPISACLVRWPL